MYLAVQHKPNIKRNVSSLQANNSHHAHVAICSTAGVCTRQNVTQATTVAC